MEQMSALFQLLGDYDQVVTIPDEVRVCNLTLAGVQRVEQHGSVFSGNIVDMGLPTLHSMQQKQMDMRPVMITETKVLFDCNLVPPDVMCAKESHEKLYLHRFCWNPDKGMFRTTDESFVHPMDRSFHAMNTLFEPFAGGYGGWSQAFELLSTFGLPLVRKVGLDSDLHASVHYALNHDTNLIGGHQKLPWDFLLAHREDCMLNMDMLSTSWKQAVVMLNPMFWALSSPCQPWSAGGSQKGFADWNGLILAEAWGLIKVIRPPVVGMEQVGAFRTHAHYTVFLDIVKWAGYRLVHMELSDLKHVTCTKRLRFLATFVANEIQTEDVEWAAWPKIDPFTPRSMQAFINMNESDRQPFVPSKKTASKYFDKSLLPEGYDNPPSRNVVTFRIPGLDVQQPTYMHQYGQQHKLPLTTLKGKGLFGVFTKDEDFPDSFRFWSPMEVLAQHMHVGSAILLSPPTLSWETLGNMIALPHAAKVAFDMHQLMTVNPLPVTFEEIFMNMLIDRIKFPSTFWTKDEFAWYVGSPFDQEELQSRLHRFQEAMQWKGDLYPQWPEQHIYHRTKGLMKFDDLEALYKYDFLRDEVHSLPATILDEPSPTLSFEVQETDDTIVKPIPKFWEFQLALSPGEYGTYMVDSAMPTDALLSLWNYTCEPMDFDAPSKSPLGKNAIFFPAEHASIQKLQWKEQLNCVPILERKDSQLIIRALPHDQSMDDWLIQNGLPLQIWDQFGQVEVVRQVHSPLLFQTCPQDPLLPEPQSDSFPRLTNIHVETLIPKMTDILVFVASGPEQELQQWQTLWCQACSPAWLQQHGRQLNWQECEDGTLRLLFRPLLSHPTTPVSIMRGLILNRFAQVFLFRHLKQPQDASHVHMVKVKSHGHVLFHDLVSLDASLETFHDILRVAFQPNVFGRQLPIVSQGKQITEKCTLSELQPKKRQDNGQLRDIILNVMSPMWGGAPGSKAKQHKTLMDLIAQLFLQAGCKFPRVTQLAEDLMQQVGPTRLQHLLRAEDSESRMDSFAEICSQANIALPEKSRSKSSADSKFRKLQLNMQHKHEALDLSRLTICEGYFENEDGSATAVATTFSPFTTGISLLSREQLSQWTQGESVLSGDELAAFVPEPCPSPVGFKHQELTIPVHNSKGNLLLLRGKLFQFGAREVKITKKLNQTQSTADIHVVAITLWRGDFDNTTWTSITQQPVRMAKYLIAQHVPGVMLIQPWGRRFRDSRGETTPDEATSVQFHCLIPESCYHSVVIKSGWNKVFVTPKTQDGKLLDKFRIIWCTLTLHELTAKVAMASGCHGLVRGKRSLGVRVDVENFPTIWELLRPGVAPPDLTVLTKQFRVEPLPFGVDRDALTSWAEKHNWKIRPIKSIGGRQWLVGSNQDPPSQVLQFNGCPVLIKGITSKPQRSSGPVMAGDAPVHENAQSLGELEADPWMDFRIQHGMATNYSPTATPSASTASGSNQLPRTDRAVVGPIAHQFEAQSNRIASLEKQFTQLAETQASHNQAVAQRIDYMDREFRTHAEQTQTTVTNMHTDLQRSIQGAIHHQDTQLANSIQELKQLFLRGHKRKDKEKEEDSDMSS
eukprot:Skav217256  [mRNA]  locus=scaffold47:794234:798958:+ [translate_table: standard]